MKYLISRVSDWACEECPCDGAKLIKSVLQPKYKYDSDEYWCQNYYEIELNSLEDLEKLIEKEGNLIITDNFGGNTEHKLEIKIYDDYYE